MRSAIAWPGLVPLLLSCACLALFRGSGEAQCARASLSTAAASAATNIRVSSDLVLIPVIVLDRRDGLVSGLEKEHFKLYEDKVEQAITHFGSEDAPVSVGFIFDASGSMRDKLSKSREAVTRFLKTANPDDEFFLVQFNDRAELVMGMTKEIEEIQNRLMWIEPHGRTALLDAIYFSLMQIRQAHNPRKALIIISDGGDNRSRHTMNEVKNLVREADVQIYAMGIMEPAVSRGRTVEELAGPELLSEVAEQTSGRLFEIESVNELPDVASKISFALRHQYVLGYAPANSRHDGKYHKVQVKLAPPKGLPKLRAYWRHGYYAPAE